jgi:penicillin-binding protein 2
MAVFNQSRSNVIRLIIIGTVVLLVAQLFRLQVLSGKYASEAFDNAVSAKRVYPSRGIIYDRKGRAILNNATMYDLVITPSQLKGIDTATLCNILGIDTATFHKRVVEAIIKNTKFRPSIFEPLLSPAMYARLDENIFKFFPAFDLVERPVRVYPFNAGAHILGYVREVDTTFIRKSGNYYQLGDYAGQSGLEKSYENILMGQRGVQYMIKDNKNRIVGRFENGKNDTAAIAGKSLRTSVDIELQQLAELLLQNKLGSVVALDPQTGGVLAMASGPVYDPNLLTADNSKKNFARLLLDPASPMLNRAISAKSPPGSTFKPLGALVALDEGIMQPSSGVGCGGGYYACGRRVGCHGGGHAGNLRSAMAQSCNSYFCHVFRKAVDNPAYASPVQGYLKWKEYMSNFGLGHRLGIDLPSEKGGYIPDTSRFNRLYGFQRWNSCSMVTMGIGQDAMELTPLQIANVMCIIANKGSYFIPHLVEKIEGATKTEDTLLNKYRQRIKPVNIPDSSFQAVADGMEDVLKYGTGRRVSIPGITMCGKTGTVENFLMINGQRKKLKDHSVFACYAPKENPRIAVAVFIQNGGFGADIAGPIASMLIEKYINDTLTDKRKKLAEEMSKRNLIPAYIKEKRFELDSSQAFRLFRQSGDSTFIKPYLPPPPPVKTDSSKLKKEPGGMELKNNPFIKVKESKTNIPAEEDDNKPDPEPLAPPDSLYRKQYLFIRKEK